MANEFVAKKGLISNGDVTVNGAVSSSGSVQSSNLTVDGNDFNITAPGDINLIPSGGNTNIYGNLSAQGDLLVGSEVVAGEIKSSGTNLILSAVGSISAVGAFVFDSDVSFNNSTIVTDVTSTGNFMTITVNSSSVALPLYVY